MFEVPVDAWYVWIGLAVVGSTVLGVVSALPAAAPPDASGTARVVDGVAASEYDAVGSHPLPGAEAVRIGTDSISLRGPGGTEHAAFGYAPVTPVEAGSDLGAVLRGRPAARAFASPAAFERAISRAKAAEPRWRSADRLTVRRTSWEGIDAVLVG
jgi:hypothetical protein